MKAIRAIIVDDDQELLTKAGKCLKEVGFKVDCTIDIDEAKTFTPEADLLIIDSMRGEDSFWEGLLAPMRERHPSAFILLITRFEDETVLAWAGDSAQEGASIESQRSRRVLEVDPLVSFLPKTGNEMSDANEIKRVGVRVKAQIEDRRRLEAILLECAVRATDAILDESAEELVKNTSASDEKKGTYGMDVITEKKIAEFFGPHINTKDILVCTEELGLQNRYHHRISAPRFLIFSDPFDGSTPTRAFLQHQMKIGSVTSETTLREVIANPSAIQDWEKIHGSHSMNSPTVSVVLAERHRVVATVIINLFTQEAVVAVEAGIFVAPDAVETCGDASLDALKGGLPLPASEGWTKTDFRSYEDVSQTENDRGHLFLGTLQARKVSELKQSPYYDHAVRYILPILPKNTFNKAESFRIRFQQNDFTPGPGRVLFMLKDLSSLETYENFGGEEGLSGQGYGCVLSCGEPLTEWIGWMAFLRHARGKVSAYCLRYRDQVKKNNEDDNREKVCTRKAKPTDPASMAPTEVNSIFKDGGMDLMLLPSGYGRSMRHYHDTLAVVFDKDPDWQKVLKDRDEEDIFVKVPTL